MQLTPGLLGEASTLVTEEVLATAPHAGAATGVRVYGTPMLIALMEHAAWLAVKDLLAPGEVTVGTTVQIEHLAPTPLGQRVVARAELVQVAGRRLLFSVEAFDEHQCIGRGQHGRAIVNLEAFLARASSC